jgi:hypothetical protein
MNELQNYQDPSESDEEDKANSKVSDNAEMGDAGFPVIQSTGTDAGSVADSNGEEETIPDSDEKQTAAVESVKEPKAPKVRKRAGWWVVGSILFVILALALGVWSGYNRGVNRRLNAQKDNLLTVAAQQLTLAYDDLENNQLDTAKQRIEYILKIYPDFPGAQEMLVDIQMKMGLPTQAPPTQTLPPTETAIGPTPTPDMRGAEELFVATKQLVSEQKWADALVNILSLRERYYDYNTAQVDGFYYVSLRNDGINKIYSGKLEQGIWELEEASQIGALDNQAAGAITLANMYVTGASYWDNNWPEAIRIFDELRQAYPNLSDATGMTTTERYRLALYKQGALFAAQNDYCSALSYYKRSLEVAQDQQIAAQATLAEVECNKPAPTAVETPTTLPTGSVEPPIATAEPPAPTSEPLPTVAP